MAADNSIENKIKETVIYGSVFEALKAGFFTAMELMEWLGHYQITPADAELAEQKSLASDTSINISTNTSTNASTDISTSTSADTSTSTSSNTSADTSTNTSIDISTSTSTDISTSTSTTRPRVAARRPQILTARIARRDLNIQNTASSATLPKKDNFTPTLSTLTDRLAVAYKALCTLIKPSEQYLSDGMHIISKKPEFLYISMAYGLDIYCNDSRIIGDETPLAIHVCDLVTNLYDNTKGGIIKRYVGFIVNGEASNANLVKNIHVCFLAQNASYIRNLNAHHINQALVLADWTDKFRYNGTLATLIIERVKHLSKQAQHYYESVVKPTYNKVAKKLYEDKLLSELNKDQLVQFDHWFPGIIDQRLISYTPLAYKISLLSNDIAGYILGFPVQNVVPSNDQIRNAISMLIEHGVKNYVANIKSFTEKTYLPIILSEHNTATYANEKDVLFDRVDSYVSFDIVSYQDGDHIYRFTRAEFEELTKSKKNPYTNHWLPITVLSTIKSRVWAAKELKLPPARPHIEMLEKMESGELYDDDPNISNDNNSSNDSSNDSNGAIVDGALSSSLGRFLLDLTALSGFSSFGTGLPTNIFTMNNNAGVAISLEEDDDDDDSNVDQSPSDEDINNDDDDVPRTSISDVRISGWQPGYRR